MRRAFVLELFRFWMRQRSLMIERVDDREREGRVGGRAEALDHPRVHRIVA